MADEYRDIISAIRTGFAQASLDLRSGYSDFNSARNKLSGDFGTISQKTQGFAANIDRSIVGEGSFVDVATSNRYNQKNSWVRDIGALFGAQYVDTSQAEARERAGRAWSERMEKFGFGAASTPLWFAGMPGLAGSLAYDLIAYPFISRRIERKYSGATWADVTGRRNVTAGLNAESMGGGFSANQEMAIGEYLSTAHKGTGFKAKEFEELYRQLEGFGALKTFTATNEQEYIRKISSAIENAKSAMKLLKVSQEGAAQIVGELNKLQINPSVGINRLSMVAAQTGLPAEQAFQFSTAMGGTLSSVYGMSQRDAYLGGMQIMGSMPSGANPGEYIGGVTKSLTRFAGQQGIYGAFLTKDANGNTIFDKSALNEFRRNPNLANMLNKSANFLSSTSPGEFLVSTNKYTFARLAGEYMNDAAAIFQVTAATAGIPGFENMSGVEKVESIASYMNISKPEAENLLRDAYGDKKPASYYGLKGKHDDDDPLAQKYNPSLWRDRLWGENKKYWKTLKDTTAGISASRDPEERARLASEQRSMILKQVSSEWDKIGTFSKEGALGWFKKNRRDIVGSSQMLDVLRGAKAYALSNGMEFNEASIRDYITSHPEVANVGNDPRDRPILQQYIKYAKEMQGMLDVYSVGSHGETKKSIKEYMSTSPESSSEQTANDDLATILKNLVETSSILVEEAKKNK